MNHLDFLAALHTIPRSACQRGGKRQGKRPRAQPRGVIMEFYELLDQVLDLVRSRGRVTYRALTLQFKLDDDHLEALKDEIFYAHPQAVNDDGRGLVWTGEARPLPVSPPAADQERPPLAYTPPHLT